jgi:uncharacterized protein (DUF1697 family)
VVALLRAVNVGGRTVRMAELREACLEAGLGEVRTHLASGNLLLAAKPVGLEARLEALLAARFGLQVPVMVRTQGRWAAYLAGNPLATAAAAAPARVVLLVPKGALAQGAVEALSARATQGEEVARCADGLVVHFPAGIGSSKLTTAVLDRLAGTPLTGRNWNTVVALAGLLAG